MAISFNIGFTICCCPIKPRNSSGVNIGLSSPPPLPTPTTPTGTTGVVSSALGVAFFGAAGCGIDAPPSEILGFSVTVG